MKLLRRLVPTHSTLVAYIALFVALGGASYAAIRIPANSVGTTQLQNASVTSTKLNSAAVIGQATNATNADNLGGKPAASYVDSCPTGTIAAGSLCVDFNTRPPDTLLNAIQICGRAQMHLADAGELGQAFDHLGASQPPEWTGDVIPSGATVPGGEEASDDSARNIVLSEGGITDDHPFRCATSATNATS